MERRRLVLLVFFATISAGCFETSPHSVQKQKELVVTNLSVVESKRAEPGGPWSFGELFLDLFAHSKQKASAALVHWLRLWQGSGIGINDPLRIAPRDDDIAKVIAQWKATDQQPGVPDDQWQVDFSHAPFRLLAIVNRIDKVQWDSFGTVQNAGEGRFIFGLVASEAKELDFTVIFEYEQVASDERALRNWAKAWHALGALQFGSRYNDALAKITRRFSGSGIAPGRPNQSALNHIRTNDVLTGPWELRDFKLSSRTGLLEEVTMDQTPESREFTNSQELADFINQNEESILRMTYTVPKRLPDGRPFRAVTSLMDNNFFWRAPGIKNNNARAIFALNTCNGCHRLETLTNFRHVFPRKIGKESDRSIFLGLDQIEVQDPMDHQVKRTFHELADRADCLNNLAEGRDIKAATTLCSKAGARANRAH